MWKPTGLIYCPIFAVGWRASLVNSISTELFVLVGLTRRNILEREKSRWGAPEPQRLSPVSPREDVWRTSYWWVPAAVSPRHSLRCGQQVTNKRFHIFYCFCSTGVVFVYMSRTHKIAFCSQRGGKKKKKNIINPVAVKCDRSGKRGIFF